MKIGDRVEVTRTYFARNEACTNWGRACFPTQGIVEFVSNRWVTLMMISPKDSKKKRNRSIIPRTGKEKSLENGARKV